MISSQPHNYLSLLNKNIVVPAVYAKIAMLILRHAKRTFLVS